MMERKRAAVAVAHRAVTVAQLLCTATALSSQSRCSATLEELCGASRGQGKAACDSCLHSEWSELAKVGCSLKTTEQFCGQQPFPPKASGTCVGPGPCNACIEERCAAELKACAADESCAASLACMQSTISDHHVASTPTDCQSVDCIVPCFAQGQSDASKQSTPDPQAVALVACAATCLPQGVVPPAQPQQVHLAYAGAESSSVAVSWITQDNATSSSVVFGPAGGSGETVVDGNSTYYSFYAGETVKKYAQHVYQSGKIHHVVLPKLDPSTLYWYKCGGPNIWSERFNFTTAPVVGRASLPYVFGLTGDLGQTNDSDINVRHFSEDVALDSILHVGDLSYADSQMMRWDTWGRMVEPVAARLPWMVAAGNHEIEKDERAAADLPPGDFATFNAYQHRFRMPAEESSHGLAINGNYWYSFDVAGVHVIVLNAYDDTFEGSPQYAWLEADLKQVDRTRTPWVITGSHCPWYNSNKAHHNEKQAVAMRAAMEPLYATYGVDIAFAGHVHAYERSHKALNNVTVAVGPDPGTVYINIGDGGNREGQYDYWYPGLAGNNAPEWSALRQPQFGHGKLEVMNATHSFWTWHRTEFGEKVVSDEAWIVRADSTRVASGSPQARGLGAAVAEAVADADGLARGQRLTQGAPIAKGLRSE